MQREATNVEEGMIGRAIQEEATWDKLPKRLKLFFATSEDWNKKLEKICILQHDFSSPKGIFAFLYGTLPSLSRVKDYCIKKRLKWSDCLARMICKESEYYEELVSYLRTSQALFPYNLSGYICRVMKITPFRYYSDILFDIMKNEKPYDSIPNFTAADALRLTGIGRNEFIDIMNKCRAKKIMWKINKAIVKDMLPTQPIDFPMEPWWTVGVIDMTQEDLKKFSDRDVQLINYLTKDNPKNLIGELDIDLVRGLFRKGVVYLDVPVFPDDHIQVSALEGFVSNKDQSYEDPTEELLYAVFVASSERATVAELATTLQADLGQLESAVSLACRLGWAKKVLDPASLLQESDSSAVSDGNGGDAEGWAFQHPASPTSVASGAFQPDPAVGESKALSGVTRFAFMVDANLTSYLMMGSLSPGLKGHAVSLYEAGKLGDSSVADMCEDLRQVEGTKLEGELQELAVHAFSLRHALDCIRSGGASIDGDMEDEAGNTALKNGAAQDTHPPSLMDMDTNAGASLSSDSASGPGKRNRKARNCKVDVIRCESLAGLPPATVQRVLRRDYNVVVSMVPLPAPPSVVSADGEGPIHFGPPFLAASSPWMKLLLYSVAQSGPVSMVLVRGQRLRLLPPYLAGCAKALIWSWDGTGLAGLGGKFEGTLVEGNILLHCLNAVLKQSAVLVQPFPRTCLTNTETGGPVTKDVPLPLSQPTSSVEGGRRVEPFAPHPGIMRATEELNLQTVGYVRFIRIHRPGQDHDASHMSADSDAWEWVPQSVELGVPLFNTELCKQVCEAVVRADLFHPTSLIKHGEAMQKLRKTLLEFMANYQPGGSVCKLTYDGGKGTHPSSSISGQWSPLDGMPPLTPTLTPSSDLQQPTRARRRSEVASFVGELPKLLPLGTLFEAPSRAFDDSVPLSPSMKGLSSNFVDEDESGDISLPGVNLIFDGLFLTPFDIETCLQGRIPAALVADAATASDTLNSPDS